MLIIIMILSFIIISKLDVDRKVKIAMMIAIGSIPVLIFIFTLMAIHLSLTDWAENIILLEQSHK